MKKVVSLLLAVMMIMTSFSVVMADNTVSAKTEEEVVLTDDFKLMQALKIFDDTMLPNSTITRRQLAEMYINIVLPEQADDEYIATRKYFDDVDENDFDINMVYEMGIMGGMGDNKFMPDNLVTYAQFVKTVVDFLGYKLKAESYGGYPMGYQIMSINFGFSKFAPSDMNLLCTTNMAAAILREAMGVRLNQIIYSTEEDGPVFLKDKINYLEAYRDIKAAEGVITATYVGDLLNNSKTEFFDIRVANELYVLNDNVVFLNDLLGNRINYFYETDADGNRTIIYAEVVDTNIIDIYPEDLDNNRTTTDEIYYYDVETDKEKEISITNAYIYYNGTICPSYDVNDINPFKLSNLDGFIRLIDLDGKPKTAEYVFVETFETLFVTAVSNGQILNKYNPGLVFRTEEFDENEIVLKNINGEHVKSSQIAVEDVLNIYRDKNGTVKKAILTVDTYVGTVKSVRKKGDDITLINLEGLDLKPARSLKGNAEYDKIKPGVRMFAVFNHLGQIAQISVAEYDASTFFAFITDAARVKTNGWDPVYYLRLFTAAGSFKELPLKETVLLTAEINSQLVVDKECTPTEILSHLGSPVQRQVCRYTTNEKGEITKLQLAVNDKVTLNGEKGLFKHNIGTKKFNKYSYGFGGKAASYDAFVLSGTPVIIVPGEANRNDDKAYVVKDRNYMYSNHGGSTPNTEVDGVLTEKLKVYGLNPESSAADIVVLESDASVDSYTSSYFIVSSKSAEYLNGKYRYVMSGYINKNSYTYEFSKEAYYSNTASPDNEYDIGDIIVIKRDVYNVVQAVDMVFDASAWTTDADYAADGSYYACTPRYIDDKVITYAKPQTDPAHAPERSYIIEGARVYVYKTDGRGVPSITVGSPVDIRATDTHGYATPMFVYDDSRVMWAYIKVGN